MNATTRLLALPSAFWRRTRFLVSGPFAVAALGLGFPHGVAAQTAYTLAAGVGLIASNPANAPGLLAQASIGRRGPRHPGWRIDAFVAEFDITQSSVGLTGGGLCAIDVPTCSNLGLSTTTLSIALAGLGASEVVNLRSWASGTTMYVIAGGETDWLFRDPSAPGAVRFGITPGLGVVLPLAGDRQVFVEARCHVLIDAPSVQRFVPVTVGIRF